MRFLWRSIANIFRWSWRLLNFIREFILNLFLIILIVAGVVVYFQFQPKPVQLVKGALLVDLSGVIVDNPSMTKLNQLSREILGINHNHMQENSLFELVTKIRHAKDNHNITGMVLALNDFSYADQPSLQFLGKALREFRDTGKPIYAFSDNYTQKQYFLASYANKIYLSPQGGVDLYGIATHGLYFKSLLDKLKISTHVFRVGTYKSAVEPLIRDDMSPDARAATEHWVKGIWTHYQTTVAGNRQLSPEQLVPSTEEIINKFQQVAGDQAQYALQNKLVDVLASRAEAEKQLTAVFGWNKKKQQYNATSIYDYPMPSPANVPDQIAVVFAEGAIIDGPTTPGSVGSETLANQIREARLNSQIKALILRVNSPGGSVSASEVISDELDAFKATGKPIVVSMGGVAASGGYWISTPANFIFAHPSTLTGSIGIFGVINTYENTLGSLGIHSDGVATSPLVDLSFAKPLPPAFSQMMQISIENGYQRFISLVAQSRHKTTVEVDQIAQGRVWLGSDATNNGLVDKLGDFDDAVHKAAELAHLNNYRLFWFVNEPNFGQVLIDQLTASVHASLPEGLRMLLPRSMGATSPAASFQSDLLTILSDPQNRYALCFTCGNLQ